MSTIQKQTASISSARKKKRPRRHRHRDNDNDEGGNNDDDDNDKDTFDNNDVGICSHVSDRYEKLGRIGKGTYGIVYKARDIQSPNNNRLVALKRCIPHHVAADGFPITSLREIENLRVCSTSCPYIVTLLDIAVSSSNTTVFLVLEYCDHCLANIIDDYYKLHGESPFTTEAVKTLLQHLLRALQFLHDEHHILHRDIKLSNLLYKNNSGRLLLADFGLSRHYSSSTSSNNNIVLTPKVASLWYRPPEILLLQNDDDGIAARYGPPMDVWAAGCVFVELYTGFPAMNGKDEIDQISMICENIGLPDPDDDPNDDNYAKLETLMRQQNKLVPKGTTSHNNRKYRILEKLPRLSEAGCQLVTCLLQWEPSDRWTASQSLRSPFFTEHPYPLPEQIMPRF